MRSAAGSLIGSALFLLIAPGTVAGYLPWLLTRWRFGEDFGHSPTIRVVGGLVILCGFAALVECFIRFALAGLGTPAPIVPTRRLVVSGLYRYVRNPMYLSVGALILGQSFLFGRADLLIYLAGLAPVAHLFVVGYEEPKLRRQFPADYADYVQGVRRWLPRLHAWRR